MSNDHVVHYISADEPGPDSTWSVYRERYVSPTSDEPIDGTQEHVSTHPNEAEAEAEARRLQANTGRTWFSSGSGLITDGNGWEVAKDSASALAEDGNEGRPWSLWHHGEYVANYATVNDAKVDANPVDCSKCLPSADDVERAGLDSTLRTMTGSAPDGAFTWEDVARHLLARTVTPGTI